MIKFIIFDLGGVLVKWSNDSLYKQIAKICKKSFLEVKNAFRPFTLKLCVSAIDERTMEKEAMRRLDGLEKLDEIKDLWWKIFKKEATANKNVIKIISTLKGNGYKIVLLSNTGGYSHIRVIRNRGSKTSID